LTAILKDTNTQTTMSPLIEKDKAVHIAVKI